MKNNIVGWFEIPVANKERAVIFYETVLEIKLEQHQFGPEWMAWFPFIENGAGVAGSLIYHADYKPSKEGTLIYITPPSGDLANELSRVEKAGGKILLHKKLISEEHGYMGLFLDTEGNRIGIHSRK